MWCFGNMHSRLLTQKKRGTLELPVSIAPVDSQKQNHKKKKKNEKSLLCFNLSLWASHIRFLAVPAMGTVLLHNPISMAKRPCPSQSPPPAPPSLNQMDELLETFLSSSSSLSVDLSFDRLLESRASSDSDQAHLIDTAVALGSALLHAAKRSARKRASSHNSLYWPLPRELTINVLSLSLSLCNFSQFRFQICLTLRFALISAKCVVRIIRLNDLQCWFWIEMINQLTVIVILGIIQSSQWFFL